MNEDQLIVAGYVLAVPAPRPPGQEHVLPETFLTISDCLMSDLPRPEFWDWYVDRQEAERARMCRAPHAEIVTVAMTLEYALKFMRSREVRNSRTSTCSGPNPLFLQECRSSAMS